MNITDFLEKYYTPDEPIILACSTWPDSMFLLYKILETPYGKNLVACYFNHKLRPEADDEEVFLENLGKEKGFKVEIATADIKKIQSLHPSISIEELARKKRYAFFDAILHIYKAKHIITAHHLDDKIETFFFNLARGSKLTGLINMTEENGWILRPLLSLEKKEILEYLHSSNLEYKIDSTNTDTEITRNYLRHEIIPNLEKINGNYKQNIKSTLSYFEEVKKFIDEEVKKILWNDDFFDKDMFLSQTDFIQKEIIRTIFFIRNGNSTIGLSESNINEIIRFIKGKNNPTEKELKWLKMRKENKKIYW